MSSEGQGVSGHEVVVDRERIADAHVRDAAPTIDDEQVLVRVDRVAMTTNNVTYAVLGEQLRYWDAYPAGDGLGIVPLWGFGTVLEVGDAVDALAVGTRLYGFWPTATHAVLRPDRIDERGLVDGSPHRGRLAGAYQRYERVDVDPMHDESTSDLEPLYRPLFTTAFLLDDQLTDPEEHGEPLASVVITSASSKTSTALAHLLAARDGVEVIGITSAGSVGHVEGTGLYDTVLAYGELDELSVDGPAGLVDVAGRHAVTRAIHDRVGDGLVTSLVVGVTHHDQEDAGGPANPTAGATPTIFFAPARAAQRFGDWGAAGLASRLGEAWAPFVSWVGDQVTVREVVGLDAVPDEWAALVAGDVDPAEGLLLVPGAES